MDCGLSIMEKNINNIEWLVGNYDEIVAAKPLQPFADEVLDDLNKLSVAILHDPISRQYPDVVTFAFFCRKANLSKLREEYGFGDSKIENRKSKIRLGRGLIFHIAPSNVPVNFAYSMVAGLLAGNTNVVRVSQKQFPQVDLIVKHMREMGMHRVAVVRYPHESNANEVFSAMSDVRVIWGGDETIAKIRQNPIKPRAFDVCFADRYSVAVINADKILNSASRIVEGLAERFYNDTYLFDQNACSAPHLILWIGKNISTAQEIFWKAVYAYVRKKYQFQEKMAVDKLTALYKQAVVMPLKEESCHDNMLRRVMLDTLPTNIDEYRCSCGYFSEYQAQSLDDLAHIVTPKYQTLAYYGFTKDELMSFVMRSKLQGLDRIVPFGETTAFSLTWDGWNLIDTLSRVISVL